MRFASRFDSSGRPARADLVAAVLVAVGLAIAGQAVATTYYVDNQSPNRSIVGPGTEDRPYSTISSALTARGGPGVTIIVKPGLYREQVTIPVSGSPGLPLVLRAQGPGVVVDGADDFGSAGRWTLQDVVMADGQAQPWTGSVWLAADVTWNPSQVFVDGVRLSRAPAVPEQLPANAFTWVSGRGLFVNLGGANPGLRATRVAKRSHGFNLFSRSWVTIEGFEVTGTEDRGINLQNGCADLVIRGNRVTFTNGYGILSVNGQRLIIEGNAVSDGHFHGIGLISGASSCIVRNNESFRNADPGLRRATGIYLFGAPGNTLAANRTYLNQDSGVQLGTGSHDCVLVNNRSWDNGDHGYDHLNTSGTVYLNNVAYRNRMDGFSIEGNSPNTRMQNCISVENGLLTGRYGMWLSNEAVTGLVSDYNIFWNSTGQDLFKMGLFKFTLLSNYQAATGLESNSIQAPPLFVDGPAGDFRLAAGSPAIDAGISGILYWPVTDAVGNARVDDPSTPNRGTGTVTYADIGALEFIPSAQVQAAADERAGTDPLGTRPAGEREASTRVAFSGGFPNPSRGAVEFAVELVEGSQVEWAVYDLQGRMVWSEGRAMGAGRSILRWDGTGPGGGQMATGVYLVRARIEGREIARRIVRL